MKLRKILLVEWTKLLSYPEYVQISQYMSTRYNNEISIQDKQDITYLVHISYNILQHYSRR